MHAVGDRLAVMLGIGHVGERAPPFVDRCNRAGEQPATRQDVQKSLAPFIVGAGTLAGRP